MIQPTPGRIVWYYPAKTETIDQLYEAPLAAIVVAVWHDRRVNLTVFDANGVAHPRTSVTLVQEGDISPADEACAGWMPYQKDQAKKHANESLLVVQMNRTPEQWAKVVPDAFLSGSIAQARNVIEMAVQDIATLSQHVRQLTEVPRAVGKHSALGIPFAGGGGGSRSVDLGDGVSLTGL